MAIRTPAGLGDAGRKFWRAILADYELRTDELRILEQAARTLDELRILEGALAGAPVMVQGSAGQMRTNPIFADARQHRALFAALCRQLALPHADEAAAPVDAAAAAAARSAAGRALVAQRWNR